MSDILINVAGTPRQYSGVDSVAVPQQGSEDPAIFSNYTLPQATEETLGGVKAKARTGEQGEIAIDSATGKLYSPATELQQASLAVLGGVKAKPKTDETGEIAIDPVTGKLYSPLGLYGAEGSHIYTAMMPSMPEEWTQATSGYYADVTVEGLLSTDVPFIDILTSDDAEDAANEEASWAVVYKIETYTDYIRIYATEIPEYAVDLQIYVVVSHAITVEQGTGQSTTDVMSQKAVTDELSSIKNVLNDNVPIEFDDVEINKAYSTNVPNGMTLGGFNTYVKNVSAGETYYITTTVVPISSYYVCMLYYDNSFINAKGGYPTYSIVTDYEVAVPVGVNKIRVTVSNTITPIIKTEGLTTRSVTDRVKAIENDVSALHTPATNYVQFASNNCYVKAKYNDDYDIVYKINIGGGNSLPDLRSVFLVANNSALNDDISNARIIMSNPSDILSPHTLYAASNGDGDHPSSAYFTGGNHRSNNTGVGGGITASNYLFTVSCDGKPVTSGVYGNEVIVKWSNKIQGYNTTKDNGAGREILKEDVTLTIRGRKIFVDIKHTALEALTRTAYYGIQMMSSSFEYIRYIGGSNRAKNAVSVSSNSENKKCREICLTDETTNDSVVVGIDDIDTGDFSNVNAAYSAFNLTYGKCYFYIVDGAFTMNDGDMTTTRGYIEFTDITENS